MTRKINPTLEFEQALWKDGFARIAGVDEAGRGAWAGPVAAAVVILPPDPPLTRNVRLGTHCIALNGVRDSKLMTPLARETWAPRIRETALAWGVGFASAEEIDALGILPATKLAATRALEALSTIPDYLLTDYLIFPEIDLPQTALIKGDQRSLSVAAASVLAKTARDARMRELDGQYPGYGFARHKGYGTRLHQEAIRQMGVCAIHRKSFSIMKQERPAGRPYKFMR
jgi:ribonuclease HII